MGYGIDRVIKAMSAEKIDLELGAKFNQWVRASSGIEEVEENHVEAYAEKVGELLKHASDRGLKLTICFIDEDEGSIDIDGGLSLSVDSETRSVDIINSGIRVSQVSIFKIGSIRTWY